MQGFFVCSRQSEIFDQILLVWWSDDTKVEVGPILEKLKNYESLDQHLEQQNPPALLSKY